jgi:methyl-accepting chemotaxis protein
MDWFKKLKIRVKLLTIFIFLVCISIFIGIYSIIQVDELNASSDEVFDSCAQPLGELNFMTRWFYEMRVNLREVRSSTELNEVKTNEAKFRENDKILEKYNKSYEAAIHNPEGKKIYDDYYNTFQTWRDRAFQCFSLKQEYITKQDIKYQDEFKALFVPTVILGSSIAEEKLQALVYFKVNLASSLNETNRASAMTDRIIMIIIIIIAAIISLILGIYIARMISRPIVTIEEKATQIANTGDLRTVVEVDARDEIFTMSEALKTMIANFRTLIQKVMSEVEHITKESDELSSVSDVSASASVELQAQTQTAASSSEEVSANVSTVASSVEELSASIKEISKNTTSATALTKQSEERANEASKVMNRLGQSSLEIGNIVKSITDIAEQTNLLALNATIEAARAGELGKGFAVVANEVKDLAKESAKATEDITKKIKAIQDDTKNAIDVIKGIIDNAVKINDVTTSIASAVEEQAVTANEVNRNIGEATVGVGSIVEVITGIMKAVNDYTDQANQVKNSSAVLKMLATELDNQIKENFTV